MQFDLHTHSVHSDGLLEVPSLVALAAANGVQLLALTDHDSTAGLDAARAACQAHGIVHITGAELSASWRGQSLHVLAFGIDPSCPSLVTHLQGLQQRRQDRFAAIAARLRRKANAALGDLVEQVAASCALPTRMHLARALVAAGHCRDTDEAFTRWLVRGRPGYAPVQWPDLTSTLSAIQAAGGVAALAHPQRYRLSSGGLRALVGEFAAAGGAALEASSGSTSPNDVTRLTALATGAGLAISAGSDFHDPALAWNRPGRFAKLPPACALLAQQIMQDGRPQG